MISTTYLQPTSKLWASCLAKALLIRRLFWETWRAPPGNSSSSGWQVGIVVIFIWKTLSHSDENVQNSLQMNRWRRGSELCPLYAHISGCLLVKNSFVNISEVNRQCLHSLGTRSEDDFEKVSIFSLDIYNLMWWLFGCFRFIFRHWSLMVGQSESVINEVNL